MEQPAADILVTLYAIYHLARSPKARPPMSSASYHMFATFTDCGFIPLYVFLAIYARSNYEMSPKTADRWTSFFTAEGATTILLLATWIGAICVAGLHAVSVCFDLWLVILFRKIANLPPDMNPLEDNLTSRSASKHKHKRSEATLVGSVREKNSKYLSGSTVSVNRQSRLSDPVKDYHLDHNQVPFRTSRKGAELDYSPHSLDSARRSRQQLDARNVYQQPALAHASNLELRLRTQTDYMASYDQNHTSQSAQGSNVGSPSLKNSPTLPSVTPSDSELNDQQREELLKSNWFVVADDYADLGTAPRERTQHHDEMSVVSSDSDSLYAPEPLKMNPSTPPPGSNPYAEAAYPDSGRAALAERRDHGNAEITRQLTVRTNETITSSVYSESAPSLKSSLSPKKSRYYGDLSAAMRGVRGGSPYASAYGTVGSPGARSSAAAQNTTPTKTSPGQAYKGSPEPASQSGSSPLKDRKGRVVSRTGADLGDGCNGLAHFPYGGMRGRRDVSGKIAEEGRGGQEVVWAGCR